MTSKEIINRNIGLTFDLVKYFVDHPKEIRQLPDQCEIEFIEKDFPAPTHLSGKVRLIKVSNSFEFVKRTG